MIKTYSAIENDDRANVLMLVCVIYMSWWIDNEAQDCL